MTKRVSTAGQEKSGFNCNQIEDTPFQENEYGGVFKNNHSVMLLIDPKNSDIVDANPAAISFYGWSRKEITMKKIMDINILTKDQIALEIDLAKREQRQKFFFQHRLSCGKIRDVEVHSGPVDLQGKQLLLSIIQDITDRKKEERIQRKLNYLLTNKVKKSNSDLDNLNTTLKVLLKKSDKDKKLIEEKIVSSHELLISPFLQKLKKSLTTKEQESILEIVESNLKELLHPFSKKISDPMVNLSPTESQVATMIKQGLTNKEIAQIFNNSVRTITNHRDNIRKKLGLVNKKINLRSFLLNL